MMEYFIDHANYKDKEIYFPNIGLLALERGQHVFSAMKIAEKLGVSRQSVRSKLKILKNIKFLTIQTTNRFSIASVINYDIYQSANDEPNQQTNPCLTSSQPTANQQLTTPNKDKKVKKVNNTYSDGFLKFWSAYPKRVGKGAAFRSWGKAHLPNLDVVISAVNFQCQSDQWQKDNGQYIPNPATWLNQCRWEDEGPKQSNKTPHDIQNEGIERWKRTRTKT